MIELKVEKRLADLIASRERYVMQIQELARLTEETRAQIERHNGAIEELQGLLGQVAKGDSPGRANSASESPAENPAESPNA